MSDIRLLFRAVIGLGVALLVTLVLLVVMFVDLNNQSTRLATQSSRVGDVATRVKDDEHASCIIQARGLPAGHHLAKIMEDLYVLLTVRPSSQQKQQPRVPPTAQQLATLKGLTAELKMYSAIELKQPTTRKC